MFCRYAATNVNVVRLTRSTRQLQHVWHCRASTASSSLVNSTGPAKTPSDNEPRPTEYELRVGTAIASLQHDLPRFFDKGLVDHSIYSHHIVLSDPHYTRLSVRGRTTYIGIAEMLRWSLRLYFDDLQFDIVRMQVLQKHHEYMSENTTQDPVGNTVRHLEVRWQLRGTRHPSFFMGRVLGLHTIGPVKNYEGVFIYTFDQEGYIGEHRIQRIVPPPSRRILLMHSLGGRLRTYWEEMKRKRVPQLAPGLG